MTFYFQTPGINATASYFGDAVLGLRQIYKVVDNLFGTMSVVNVYLSHREAIDRLIKDPSVRMIITKEGTLDFNMSDLDNKSVLSDMGTSFSCGKIADAPFDSTRLSCDGSDVSSVILSPIAKVPVVDTDSSESSEKLRPAAE